MPTITNSPSVDSVIINAIHNQPMTDPEKVMLAGNFEGYVYGRCGKHGVIALPDAKGSIRATGAIPCPNLGCSATTVLIADPVSYLAERHIKPLTFAEIAARLEAEGITAKQFVRELFPDDSRRHQGAQRLPWLGPVNTVHYEHHPKTKEELEHEIVVYHLPAHHLYLRAHGAKERPEDEPTGKKKWDYSPGLQACKPHEISRTQVLYY